MKINDLEKLALKNDITELIQNKDNYEVNCDCYCMLMKQMFLSESTLN